MSCLGFGFLICEQIDRGSKRLTHDAKMPKA